MSDTPKEDISSHRADRKTQQAQRSKKGRVVVYLAILFAAAFLLLLLSYFMQQRANEQAITDLTQSLTSVHSLQNLVDVNAQLQTENEELEKEIATLKDEAEALAKEKETLAHAMDYFWQLDEAYVRGRYGLCRDLIDDLEATSGGTALKDCLPKESTTDTDRFSPADRYQEIVDALD